MGHFQGDSKAGKPWMVIEMILLRTLMKNTVGWNKSEPEMSESAIEMVESTTFAIIKQTTFQTIKSIP